MCVVRNSVCDGRFKCTATFLNITTILIVAVRIKMAEIELPSKVMCTRHLGEMCSVSNEI
jgi:hypothetical protein